MNDRKNLLPKRSKDVKGSRKFALWRKVLYVVISLVVGINIYLWNAATLASNIMPMPFGWGSSVVMSGSMEPALSENDFVVIHEVENYQVGDIAVYQSGRMLVIHRIISIQGDTVILQGDANNAPDVPVPMSAIKGKLVLAIPKIGKLIRTVKSTPSILIILIAFLLIEQTWREQKRTEQENLQELKQQIQRLREGLDKESSRQSDSQEEVP